MTENLSRHFNEKGFVIAQNLLESIEIEHYKQALLDAIKVRKQLDKRQLSPIKKIKFSDHVINNNGSLKNLRKNVMIIKNKI